MEKNKIFITGYAKLPEGITATELYKVVAIGVVVDRDTSEILEADVTLSTKTGKKFVAELLVGHKLMEISKIEGINQKKLFWFCKKCNSHVY